LWAATGSSAPARSAIVFAPAPPQRTFDAIIKQVRAMIGHTGGSFIAGGNPSVVANSLADALQLTDFSLADVTDTLRGLSSMAAIAAFERMTENDLARLDANVAKAAELTRAGQWTEKVTAHLEFHRLLAEATGNPILVLLMRSLLEVVYKVTISQGPTRDGTIVASRRALLDALHVRDSDAAVRELATYFDQLHAMWRSGTYDGSRRTPAPH